MRRGKECSQAAHASMKVLLDKMTVDIDATTINRNLSLSIDNPINIWLEGLFTKIVVSVDSEFDLLKIYTKAKINNIPCSLILDSGLTEFKGIPTYTCCALGPDIEEKINLITGELPLL